MGLSDFLKKHRRKLLALGLATGAATGAAVNFIHKKRNNDARNNDEKEKNKILRQIKAERAGHYIANIANTVHTTNKANSIVPDHLKLDHPTAFGVSTGVNRGIRSDLNGFIVGRLANRMLSGNWKIQSAKDAKRYRDVRRIVQGLSLAKDIHDDHTGLNNFRNMYPNHENN